jgi:RNA polymerase sigma-70 factor (ECF subfamily)
MDGEDVIALYDLRAKELTAFFVRRTGNQQVALDLLGATFLTAFEKRRRCRGRTDGQRAAWLYRIAANKLIDHYRRGAGELDALRRLGAEQLALTAAEVSLLESETPSGELAEAVLAAFASLSREQQDAVRLHVIEERDYADVSRELGLSEPATRARVSRGLRALRRAAAQEDSR